MPAQILPTTTAGTHPAQFSDNLFFAGNKTVAAILLGLFILIGFALRVNNLGAESLSEDELNKLETVKEYRTNGLSGKNGEHPFLMKGLQTVSIAGAEKFNGMIGSPTANISEEAALRFPLALFGSFTTLLMFLLASGLFGRSIGLVSAAFWAVEPMAIGFDRVAKEDSLVLFFFLLAMVFWTRSQTAAEKGNPNWTWFAWGTAASYGGLLASKYYPHFLSIAGAYYNIFQYIPETKWRMEALRWVKFLAVVGIVFLILNPTIMLPDTWREMLKFSSENRIGHDSYEYMGGLFPNKMSAWLSGVPWTFYYVFIAVKTTLPILVLFLVGLPIMFKRRLGDGRFLIFFWAFMFFMPFTFLGGKFTRYFTFAEPILLIVAAIGFCSLLKWISDKLAGGSLASSFVHLICLVAIIMLPLYQSLSATPHFRLFTNSLGGGMAAAGSYFPHDEFYDTSTRDIIAVIAAETRPGATVACETPALFEHYAHKAERKDLVFVSLSDKSKVLALKVDDLIVLAKGRRYRSNSAYIEYLSGSGIKPKLIKIGDITSAEIYKIDPKTLDGIRGIAAQ